MKKNLPQNSNKAKLVMEEIVNNQLLSMVENRVVLCLTDYFKLHYTLPNQHLNFETAIPHLKVSELNYFTADSWRKSSVINKSHGTLARLSFSFAKVIQTKQLHGSYTRKNIAVKMLNAWQRAKCVSFDKIKPATCKLQMNYCSFEDCNCTDRYSMLVLLK